MNFIVDESDGNIIILRSVNERYISGKNEFLYISVKRDKIYQARSSFSHNYSMAEDNDFVIKDLKYPYMVDMNFKRNVYDIIKELFGNKRFCEIKNRRKFNI